RVLASGYQLLDAAEDRAWLTGAKLHDRQHRVVVCRDVKDRGGDDQSPGSRDAVRLARVQGALATRASFALILRNADHAASLAADGAGQATTGGVVCAAVIEPLPHRLAIEGGIHPDEDKGQTEQCINTGRESDRHEVAELHISDEHPKDEDVDHRPR